MLAFKVQYVLVTWRQPLYSNIATLTLCFMLQCPLVSFQHCKLDSFSLNRTACSIVDSWCLHLKASFNLWPSYLSAMKCVFILGGRIRLQVPERLAPSNHIQTPYLSSQQLSGVWIGLPDPYSLVMLSGSLPLFIAVNCVCLCMNALPVMASHRGYSIHRPCRHPIWVIPPQRSSSHAWHSQLLYVYMCNKHVHVRIHVQSLLQCMHYWFCCVIYLCVISS